MSEALDRVREGLQRVVEEDAQSAWYGFLDVNDVSALADRLEALETWAQTFLADFQGFITAFEAESPWSSDGEWLESELKSLLAK